MKASLKRLLKRWPRLNDAVRAYRRQGFAVFLEFPVANDPRYTPGHPQSAIHSYLTDRRDLFAKRLNMISAAATDGLEAIGRQTNPGSNDPSPMNSYFYGLDAAVLYGMMGSIRPRKYLEVGSGNSTLFARRAIQDFKLDTTLISIDPLPRTGVEDICDVTIRAQLQETDLSEVLALEKDDVLFIDGSHYAFTNTDVTTIFLEVLPQLSPGVVVHLHDIFLPYDYPAAWTERYYNEQYLLATLLLFGSRRVQPLMANRFALTDPTLRKSAERIRRLLPSGRADEGSFWMKMEG